MKRYIYLISPQKIKGNRFYSELDLVLKSNKVKYFQLRIKKISTLNLIKISKKIYSSIWNSDLNVFSSIIKKIAFITIAIGLSSIILSVFILEGFKKEIKKKVYNFSGHYDVSSYADGITFQNSPIELDRGLFSKYTESNKIKILLNILDKS